MNTLDRIMPVSPNTILADWRREVKDNNIDEFWKSIERDIKELLRGLLESTMQEELVMYTGREWNQKLNEKIDYRNGYYYRDLLTNYGNLRQLRIPRLRRTKVKTKVFKNYQRRVEAVDRALKDVFLAGVSTRRVGEALSCLLDTSVSATSVSNVTKALDKEVKKFHNKTLLDQYQYLILDAITIKVKDGLKYSKRAVLAAYGITMFGTREIISFRQVKKETKPAWTAFLNDLFKRGLESKNLRLIVTDGHKGLIASLEEVYSFIPHQRCWAHKSRNVTKYLPKALQKKCSADLRKIYNADSRQKAINQFKAWKRKWNKVSPKAVDCLEKDMPDMLRFFDFPKEHRIKIRTTNAIERSFREVRRRIRTMNCFSNPASCDRIMFAVLNHLNKHWKEHSFKKFNQLDDGQLWQLTQNA